MVQGHDLPSEHLRPAPNEGRDHGSKAQAAGCAGHARKHDPGVCDVGRLLGQPKYMIPEEEPVPTLFFG